MADCCTPGSGFPNAANMELLATNNAVVWEEICLLQQAILAASSQCQPGGGQMCTVIGGTTPMTFIAGVLEVNIDTTTSTAPTYEAIVATAGQTIVNTTVSTIPMTSNVSYLQVFINGVFQAEGLALSYTVTGATQLTFNAPLVVGDNIVIYSYVGGVTTGGGSGYYQDEPAVEFVPPLGAPASGATGTVVTNGSQILGITVTNGGTGYQPIPATTTISSIAGTGGIIEPLVNSSGNIVGVNIVNGGTSYTLSDSITAIRAVAPNIAYVNAVFKITSVSITGQILEVAILNPGSGYQPSVAEVRIVSTLNPAVSYPLGSGFYGTVFTDLAGVITGVSVDNGGAGYDVYLPYLVITDPGTGAVTQVNLSGTSVASIDVLSSGNNYTTSATGIVYNPPTAALPNPPANPAIVDIVVAENTFGTNPNLYYQVWAGTATNKPIQLQMNTVLSYFKGLGYTIIQQTNPATGTTFQWKICW